MGSKKHKKESKKRKHKSRSRSPLDGDERERKRHKKHKDRKKERSPDVEEVAVDSHLSQDGTDSRSDSAARDRDQRSVDSQEPERSNDSAEAGGGGAQESLSVEETNKLRVKLGLKPLELSEKPAEDGKFKDDLGEFYHKPAANLAAQRKADKLRERLQERKEKRALEQKLQTTLLADASDDEDAAEWVKKSRVLQKQKQEAAKMAARLEELDEAFGVGALLEQDARAARQASYAAPQLRGLRVAHHLHALADERETVLTLEDKDVLAEDAEDVLVNVNLVDDERYKKNVEERKKARAGYQAYDEEAELQAALGLPRAVLAKYDDEIEPGRGQRARGFRLGDEAALDALRFKEMLRHERLAGGPDRRLESLALPPLRLASDYLDEHEITTKFKKVKKKGKIRKKMKAEPVNVDEYDPANVPLDTDDTEVKPEQLGAEGGDEEEVEPDGELQAALARARRLRQAAREPCLPNVEEILEHMKEEEAEVEGEEVPLSEAMMLDATAEFCRTLGDIPTYGQAGNRDHAAEIMDFEQEQLKQQKQQPGAAEAAAGAGEAGAEEAAGAWSRVEEGAGAGARAGLEAEPALGAGVAGALRLALSKGYLERAGSAPAPPPRRPAALLAAAVYSIEDKTYAGEDDKYGRRERGHGHAGPLTEFREKGNFRPNIKLEYVDDDGRALCPKEAFRYLSHKFHGKGPGKNKQEKRIKKQVQEGLMKKMSSTDTPLGTLHMLQQKQRETQSPFVLLSGAKKEPTT